MNEISSVNNTANFSIQSPNVNFKSTNLLSKDSELDSFEKEQEKLKKKAEKERKFNKGVQIAWISTMAISAGAMLALLSHQYGWFKKFKLDFKDLAHEKGLDDIALPQSQKDAAERISNRIENYDEIIKKGGRKGTSILFYGPPGTGKNTFAYAIAKKFPNAKFLDMDVSKMNSKWHGESEQNVLGTIEATIKYADKHPDEKIFVFIDEIDSVMMKDNGSGAKLSQDILNAFKKGFNKLTNKKNIIVMGATNLHIDPAKAALDGKILDTAMVDRFAQTILVDLPTKDQIKEGIRKFYSNSQRGMLDDKLTNFDHPNWDKIAEFLAKPEHETSFRKLEWKILGMAGENCKTGKNLTFEDIIKSIEANKETLNATDAEIKALKKSLT